MNDPGCAHETIDVVGCEGGDAVGNKTLKRLPKSLAFCQDRAPGEASLESLQHEAFEDARLVVDRQAPLGVVVAT